MKLIRTTSDNKYFIELVKLLDADLAIRDGKDHAFYAQYNKIDKIKHVVLAFENNNTLACGAMKEYDEKTMEIKRMYTLPHARKKGLASKILHELEIWAAELGYLNCILETGIKQPEAIKLYEKNGYLRIENYGQYALVKDSGCFKKQIGQNG